MNLRVEAVHQAMQAIHAGRVDDAIRILYQSVEQQMHFSTGVKIKLEKPRHG